jgi:hypothetical protein
MKKHLLLASAAILALAVASPAFAADNDSNIDQIAATNSSALVIQESTGGSTNLSTVLQLGNGDEAYVTQHGDASNTSHITQTGVAGAGNVAGVIQMGTTGPNSSTIVQTVDGGASQGNGAHVIQGAEVQETDVNEFLLDIENPPGTLPNPTLGTATAASSTSVINQGHGGNYALVNQY